MDPATYRPGEEVDRWREAMPDRAAGAGLRLAGVSEEDLRRPRATCARDEMRAISAEARDTEWPDARGAFADVQDTGSPAERAF